jgi:hypothetical protein
VFKELRRSFIGLGIVLLAVSPSFAAVVKFDDTVATEVDFGGIKNLPGIFTWAFNFAYYLGWAFVVVAIIVALAVLAYKMFLGEGEDAMKNVQSYMTKVVITVIIGLLLISASFVMKIVFVDVFGAADPGALNPNKLESAP